MTGLTSLTRRAQGYWALIVACGITGAFLSIPRIHPDNIPQLVLLSAIAVAVSGFKIRLPGIRGTLSVNYVTIIVALLNCDTGTGVAVAVAATLGQCLIHTAEKPRWFQVLFSVCATPLPVIAASLPLYSRYVDRLDPTGCSALLGASLAYFAVNTLTIAMIIALTTTGSPFDVWKESYLWTSPQYLIGGVVAWAVHGLERGFGLGALIIAGPPLYLLYRSYTTYLGRVQEQQDNLAEMAGLHLRTIETLALAIDAKDDSAAAHLHRIQIFAAEIGTEMKLSSSDMQALNAAALLHDVGKLAVPEYIVSKPGKLTAEEFEKMKIHPAVGAEILARVDFPYPVVPIVRSHHERYDGSGYPDGLSGEQIPIGARILAVVDCLDALMSDREYRQAIPAEEAMKIIAGDAGRAFDPRVVEVLQRRYQDLVRMAAKDAAQVDTEKNDAQSSVVPAGGMNANPDFSQSIANARQEIQLLTEVINDLGTSLSLDDTINLLGTRLHKAIAYDSLAFYLVRNERLIPRFVKGESSRLFASLEIPVGQGISGWVAENNKPILNGNPSVEAGYLNDPRNVTPLRSAVAVPLCSNDGMVGVLTLYSLRGEAFSADDSRLLLAIAPKAAQAIANSLRFERVENAADTDELTGLANARNLFSYLAGQASRSARDGSAFTLMVMDLDGFKQTNDQFGHLAGNRILQAVAKHLCKSTRAGDLVARVGGDEFVVVMTQPADKVAEYVEQLDHIADRLKNEVECAASISISVGVALYPEDGTNVETLFERADKRMYQAKHKRRAFRTMAAEASSPAAIQ